MTRRKFIRKLIKAGVLSSLVARRSGHGSRETGHGAVPRKFVRAIPFKKYPGSLRPLQDIPETSKWSG